MQNFFVEVYVFSVPMCNTHVKVPAWKKWETLNNWNMYKIWSASEEKSLQHRNVMNWGAKIKHGKLCNSTGSLFYDITLQKFYLIAGTLRLLM